MGAASVGSSRADVDESPQLQYCLASRSGQAVLRTRLLSIRMVMVMALSFVSLARRIEVDTDEEPPESPSRWRGSHVIFMVTYDSGPEHRHHVNRETSKVELQLRLRLVSNTQVPKHADRSSCRCGPLVFEDERWKKLTVSSLVSSIAR